MSEIFAWFAFWLQLLSALFHAVRNQLEWRLPL